MWIRRRDYDYLQGELTAARTKAAVLSEQSAQARTQIAFMMARCNHLEQERAVYLRQLTKLDIPTPELAAVQAPPAAVREQDILAAMGSSMFEDMGEDEARRQGIGWDTTGGVEYGTPSKNGREHG